MRILDRHILLRFLGNFALLFALLFVFAISIDIIIQWEKFVDATAVFEKTYDPSRKTATALGIVRTILAFHGPRVFQFYQYMMPLVALGAMGFTASAMHRNREFTAMLAAGVSMRRAVMPILLGMVILCLMQAANQEFILPRLATRLLLEHGDMLKGTSSTWSIALMPDSQGRLIHAQSFDPATATLKGLYVVERTPEGAVSRRIEASSAKWDANKRVWVLQAGRAGTPSDPRSGMTGERAPVFLDQPIAEFQSDIDPQALSLRQHQLYAHMLSLAQIAEISRGSAVDPGALRRYAVGRFAALAVALCMLAISIPFFALREPANLLAQSVRCAAISIPLMLTSMVMLTVAIPSITPTVGVVLPVVLLLPIAVWRLGAMKS